MFALREINKAISKNPQLYESNDFTFDVKYQTCNICSCNHIPLALKANECKCSICDKNSNTKFNYGRWMQFKDIILMKMEDKKTIKLPCRKWGDNDTFVCFECYVLNTMYIKFEFLN